MNYLSLSDARILHIQGWGQVYDPSLNLRIELAQGGVLNVYSQGWFGEKKILWLNLVNLEFQICAETVSSGGGFIGGGFGLLNAAEGMLQAAVLNALTTKRREYALLGAFTHSADGSIKEVVFGFRNITESELRKKLAEAVPRWVEEIVQRWLVDIQRPQSQQDVEAAYKDFDCMLTRNLLNIEQHARIEAALAKHFKRPVAVSSGNNNAADRVAQLKTLADLRQSGALTETEFQAEKSRLLGSS